MSDHIPEALLIDILKRLTIEDLVRSISVCKSWYSLITSPHFISLHAKQLASIRNNDLVLVREGKDEYKSYVPNNETYSIHLDCPSFPVYKTLDFPFKSWNPHFHVIGSVNGVICLSDDKFSILHNIILWNPSIRKSVTLPSPLVTYTSHGGFMHHIGFGFDPATNEYKVVRVVYLVGGDVGYRVPPLVEVYGLSEGSWRSIDAKGFPYVIDRYGSQVFLNGAVLWIGSNVYQENMKFFNMIVSFDLGTEALSVMKLPDIVADQRWPRSFSVYVLRGSLAVIHHIGEIRKFETCSVWVMKQYGVADSWTKQLNIDLTTGFLKVCGVLKNEEALVSVDYRDMPFFRQGNALVSYDPKSKRMDHIKEIRDKDSIYVDSFVETLALLGVKGGESMKLAESENVASSERSSEFNVKKKRKFQE